MARSTRHTEHAIEVKRVYEPATSKDGARVLVDRLWPRGLSKDEVSADLWMKDVAPSSKLRKWFGHVPERWPEFRRRYRTELESHTELLNQLVEMAQRGKVTLLFGAKDEERNQAVVLLGVLRTTLARLDKDSASRFKK